MIATKKLLSTASILAVLALAGLAVFSVGSVAAAPAPGQGTELEFAGDDAAVAAGQVAVPVECVGGQTSFCSGSLSVSSQGKRSVSTFSVQGGSDETVFVPLPTGVRGRPAKVQAVATTSQPLGAAVTRKAILHLHR